MNTLKCSLVVPIILALLIGAGAQAKTSAEYAADEILITVRAGLDEATSRELIQASGHDVVKRFRFATHPHSKLNRSYLVRIPPGSSVEEALEAARIIPGVEAAQPNYIYRALEVPDDPYYPLQWGLENTGDNSAYDVYGLRGPDPRVSDADMDLHEASDLWTGMSFQPVTVAVIDTGVDLTHPDLAPNIWINPGEVPGNGVDDDSNGYPDDVDGWDFVDDDNDPDDPDGHGTHVGGLIGALAGNSNGVAGVAPNAKLLPLRFLDDTGAGSTADAIDAITYAVDHGALVINASWGRVGPEPLLHDAIAAARDAGVLFVAAAGNDGSDNDITPHYPSGYALENIISVGASNPWLDEAEFSNFGDQSVHIFAPGDEIISTNPADGPTGVPETAYQIGYDSGYPGLASWGGTSMAAPHVTGAAAVLLGLGDELWPSTWNTWSPVQRMTAVRDRILTRAERWASLSGLASTDGHLDLLNLVESDAIAPDGVGTSLTVAATGPGFVTLRWTATGDDGSTGTANYYDLRYQPGPTIDFATAAPLPGVWTPGSPGSLETYTLAGLSPDTEYTFGLEVVDNVGNRSPLAELSTTTRPPGAGSPSLIPLLEDSFGGDDCSQWNLVGDWGCESDSLSDSVGGDYPVNYRASAQLAAPVSFEGAQAVEISFEFPWAVYEEDYDFLYFEYSLDGTSWRAIDRYTGSPPTSQYYDLAELAGQPEVYFRFRSLSDYGYNYDGARIDNFRVDVSEVPTCVDDIECDDGLICTIDTCDSVLGCTNAPDPTCTDVDADGVGDPDDNCFDVPNGPFGGTCVAGSIGAPCVGHAECDLVDVTGWCSLDQGNLDGDSLGDACDPDQDGDGIEAAAGDCDDRSGLVYPGAPEICDGQDNDCDGDTDNVPPPLDTPWLRLSGDDLYWDPLPDATGYDVVRGSLTGLAESGLAGTVTGCLFEDVPPTVVSDPETPLPDDGFWYLLRSINCGGSGSYGDGAPTLPQTRDEATAASGLDCVP